MYIAPALISTAALLALLVSGPASPALAAPPDSWGLNGTYIATSNGEWARTNEVFHDETSLRSTWTISTQCSFPTDCTGTVRSDAGWTAPIYEKGGVWWVKRALPNWEPCADGAYAEGLQIYRFAGATPDGATKDPKSNVLVGEDQTTGPSGGCGISEALFINMPFKLVLQG